jgi:Tfp pilus assembly protein PilO
MNQIFSSIAANIWVLIPVTAIVGAFATAIVSEWASNKRLKEENEMLKELLSNKERQLNQMMNVEQQLKGIERKLLNSAD